MGALKDLTLAGSNPNQLQVQSDAAINIGNSGGPGFNAGTGGVAGVAFARKDEGEGQGFIIPVPAVKFFMGTLHRDEVVKLGPLPVLGIEVQSLENPSLHKNCFGGA